jgi:TolB-like protein/class 3 adenylate cyclase/Flp pilus assembly protein TadD
MTKKGRRRLAAIMFTDIVGYSKSMQEDEQRGLILRERHKDVFEKCTLEHRGEVIQYYGDGTLSVFESAVSAVECAVSMQKEFQKDPQVPLRIGIHLGDIIYDETEVFGHGVNVAARIEPTCNPGGIFISDKVYDEIKNQPNLNANSLGIFQFKNINRDVGIYAIKERGIAFPDEREIEFIKEISNKMNLATAAEKSAAISLFQSRQKKRRRKKLIPWFAGAAFLLFSVFAFSQWGGFLFSTNDNSNSDLVSIAVLPFMNMSGTEENEYFSDGMTEDILTLISKLEGFSVTSRTSVMQYKNTEKTSRKIGKELSVDHILEGSVRRDGDQVRITAQLIDAKKDEHIWAKTYDEEVKSIFEVQSAVATDIALHLKKELSSSDMEMMDVKPTKDVAAYENYLKGREFYRKYNPKDNEKAISFFNKALESDPNYAYAFAGLGDAYAQKAYHKGQDKSLLDSAEMVSQKAIQLDPMLSDGYKALGLVYHYKEQPEKAMQEYRKAIKLDPYNDMASNNLGQLEIAKGNIVEGAKWVKHTYEVNKNVPASVLNMAKVYYDLGDNEMTQTILDDGLVSNPDNLQFHELKTGVLIREGKYEEAKREAEKIIENNPESALGYSMLGDVYTYEENWDSANEQFKKAQDYCTEKYPGKKSMIEAMVTFTDQQKEGIEPGEENFMFILKDLESLEKEGNMEKHGSDIFKSSIFAIMGEEEKAINCVKVAVEKNWMDYNLLQQHPVFKNLQDNPEFQTILKEIQFKSDSLKTKLKSSNS